MKIKRDDDRFGAARLATEDEIRRAGLFEGRGLHMGYFGHRRISLETDNPGIVIAPSGAGKCRDLLVETILRGGSTPFLVFDPKAELAAITKASFIRHGVFMWCWNPCNLHGLPHQRLNPLDHLTRDNPFLHGDCRSLVEGMIPLSGGNSEYFELRAREYVESLIISLIELEGGVTFPSLWRIVQAIESSAERWDAHLTAMERSRYPDIRAAAGEMSSKQRDAPREFYAIVGTVKAHFSVLNDPILSASLENADFSLRALTEEQVAAVFINIPRDYIRQWALISRTIFVALNTYKSRAPTARKVVILADEAGQMGNFQALLDGQTFNRGAKVQSVPFFQDVGQIIRNFGPSALQTFISSSDHRRFFGVGDIETARLVSAMIGNETRSYDDTLQREAARRQQWEAARSVMNGGDPFAAAFDFDHFGEAAQNRAKVQRALIAPEEVLSLPAHKQIIFLRSCELPPILADKYPYWEQRDLAGSWLPSPFFAPFTRVKLPGLWGGKWRDVIEEEVPAHLALYPQHQSGRVQYVAGYRPW